MHMLRDRIIGIPNKILNKAVRSETIEMSRSSPHLLRRGATTAKGAASLSHRGNNKIDIKWPSRKKYSNFMHKMSFLSKHSC